MPIYFSKFPELNMIFFHCIGNITAQEYFKTVRIATNDARHGNGVLKIVDLLMATTDFDLGDMYEAISFSENTVAMGRQLDHTVVLSHSAAIGYLITAMKLMSKVQLRFDAFPSLDQAILALGLSDVRDQIMEAYQDAKNNMGLERTTS